MGKQAKIEPRTWKQVWGGGTFDWRNPRAEDVSIRTIVVVLSRTCRYRCHCRNWYSVADHTMHVLNILPPEWRREGFLHDAHEAYTPWGDMPRPDKAFFPIVDEVEYAIDLAICERFGLSIDRLRSDVIREADDRVLATEYRDVRWQPCLDVMDELPDPLPEKITPLAPGFACERMFRSWAMELGLWE